MSPSRISKGKKEFSLYFSNQWRKDSRCWDHGVTGIAAS